MSELDSSDSGMTPGIHPVNIEQEMKVSYLDYAMSVIVGRALPDVRDGLKPAHRRVLYAMYREGLLPNKRYSKCAGIVGEVLKKYHPHGDAAVYDTLVRLAQDWNLRYPLIDGQGNFGSIDGDSAAAYRYTEARLTRLAEEMLADIEKETVDFVPNFDESTEEPVLLPTKFPNLLINGSAGIAVGMATNIPPHNLREIVDALIHVIAQPKAEIDDLLKIVNGPDFPTAGFIYGGKELQKAYHTGRGIVRVRGRVEIEPTKKDRERIVVDQIPYQVNKAKLVEKIADLVRDKKVEGISDLRDESSRQGMRIVIDLKKDVNANIILNQLYKHTPLQTSFGFNMVAIVNGQPRLLNLKDLLKHFISHRKEIVTRRTIFDLRKAEHEAHILEGLKIALDHLDAIIALIRKSKDPTTAKSELTSRFKLSEIQAQAILDMRLARLTGLEREKILKQYEMLLDQIKALRGILADEKKIFTIIKEELEDIKKRFGDDRRSEIVEGSIDLEVEDLIQEEDMVVTISNRGYIKRNPITIYRSQKRGGRGVMGMGTKEEDFVNRLFVASTHSYILFFTGQGRVFWLKVHEIPQVGRTAKGKAMVNLLNLKGGDLVTGILPVRRYEEGYYILQCTRKGIVKKTDLMAYSKPRPGGIIALNLDKDDELIAANLTDGRNDVFMGTRKGLSIRFSESDARPIGRAARGVRGIQLSDDDSIVGMEVISQESSDDESHSILTVTERGYGKRTKINEYRRQGRSGRGIINLKVTERVGEVVSFVKVRPDDEIMVMTDSGNLIRTEVSGIPIQGRNTQGVRTISVGEDERVIGITKIVEQEESQGKDAAAPETSN